ncbi:hypothetical protein AB0945_21405 [Streptomyces sp. NPDC005474]|uniref:hypothetical protein n=1 Tax=Streptomyces sp. NPDC005474 TaxID=3154878 RepID=UPI0034567698
MVGMVSVAAILLSACMNGGSEAPEPGDALNGGLQSQGLVGSDQAKVGQDWWFALPVPVNKSSKELEITKVSLVEVPKGMKVIEYGAYDRADTEGLALLVLEGAPHMPRLDRLKNYINEPIKVAAHKESEIYYLAHLKITGQASQSARYCRFLYRQGGKQYAQTLDCEVKLQTKPTK